ncbi:GGDEF domain-containing protein [Neopusillimonas aromaticivorans]|uniref:GGDEF domain-containing protein n=1 Tax=Neopusillimonas aromaticivorans TaxID=2979868 RepID=UPI0025995A09|nr:GGDEF domain-containing protein [Neopusillimonas aromaticivorans]WJJ94623.1 GGDEF domain-containing protein [Neopusillimonas aromaticivorans]
MLISAFNRLLDKLKEQQAELSRAAHHDSLTGLPNRRLLADRIKTALATARRQNTRIALLFMDLDEFKPINDTLGHEAGDKVLQLVARRLQASVRETDSVARLGGDEFVILMTNLGDDALTVTELLAEKIMTAIKAPFDLDGSPYQIGTSIGAAVGDGNQTEASLMRLADNLMYEAKAAGRGRYVVQRAG